MSKKKPKLLIVDDERDICNFVKMLFTKRGFTVDSALTGTSAVKLAKKISPDIALIDIHLKKGIDGLDVLKQINTSVPGCRCIMVTWDSAEDKKRQAKSLNAVAYLTKPLTVRELYSVVSRQAKTSGRKRGK